MNKRAFLKGCRDKYGIYIGFALLLLLFSLFSPTFLTATNIINLLLQTAPYAIAATGAVFVLLTAGTDLSIGATVFASASIGTLAAVRGGNITECLLAALVLGLLIGVINGFFIAYFDLVPFIITLATMSIVRGTILIFTDQKTQYLPDTIIQGFTKIRLLGIPVSVFIMIAVLFMGEYVLRYTPFGRRLFAIGNNKAVAAQLGIRVRRNIFWAYCACGLLSGLAGMLFAVQIGSITPGFGAGMEFMVISAAVLGGCSLFGGKGNVIPGTIMGIFIIMSIENEMVLVRANPYAYTIVRGIVISIAVYLDSMRNQGELR
jgi:ribose/xylose/arabinose/galactoside ABC-type transport system permease subunit